MGTGSWAAARRWAIADARAGIRGLVGLGLLAGLTAGLALATLAGGLRSGTALDRLEGDTNASDAVVFASQVGAFHPDWSALEARPGVRAVAPWALVFGALEGEDEEVILFAPVGGRWMQEIDRPVVIDGRLPHPDRPGEMVITETLADVEGIGIGFEATFTPATEDETVNGVGDAPDGTPIVLRVVGIVRTTMDLLFVGDGMAITSPALLERPDTGYVENATVQLDDPEGGIPQLEADATNVIAPGTPVLDLGHAARRVTASTDVERAALLLLAVAIGATGLILVGQVAVRSASRVAGDARVLQAIGLRRRELAGAATMAHLPAVGIAAATTVLVAWVTSRWLPIGTAARVDPDRGLHLEAPIVLPGALALAALLVAGAFATGWLLSSSGNRIGRPARTGPVEWVRRHVSPSAGIGTTMALVRTGGGPGLPVVPALLGAVVGVLGLTAALTLDAGLRDALEHPERAGVVWDAVVDPPPELIGPDGLDPGFVRQVLAVDEVDSAVQVQRTGVPVASTSGLPTFALTPLTDRPADIELVTLEGRAPARPGEAAIGPKSADSLGLDVGDTVPIGPGDLPVRIVGVALFPPDVHAQFDEGLWLHPDDLDAAITDAESRGNPFVAVRFAEGGDDAGAAALYALAGATGAYVEDGVVPPELANLDGVRRLPVLLAAFLALIAAAALLQALVLSTRVRANDFAVLRAIGFTRRAVRRVVNVHALVVFVVGLAVGIPTGIAAGRTSWRMIAERVPLQQVGPWAAVATILLVPLALLTARAIAVGPARRAARLRAADILRTE